MTVRQVAVAQSVQFARGLRATELKHDCLLHSCHIALCSITETLPVLCRVLAFMGMYNQDTNKV
jgi:hypothetical protein